MQRIARHMVNINKWADNNNILFEFLSNVVMLRITSMLSIINNFPYHQDT